MSSLLRLGLIGGALLYAGCTFYTACPTGNNQDNGGTPANMGGGAGTSGGGGDPFDGLEGTGAEIVIPGEWEDGTGDLVGVDSGCGNVMYLTNKPGSDKMIAGIVQNGLWESSDGKSWTKLGSGEGSAEIVNVVQSIVFDPENPDVFWESGLYYGGGIYRTDDGGTTFKQLGEVSPNETVSVDFTDPERQTLLAAGHERAGVLWLSKDGGETWDDIGANIPPGTVYCDFVHVLNADNFLIGCTGVATGQVGIFRSDDGGDSWALVSEAGGFREPLVTSKGTIFWAPLTVGGMVKSTDDGKTWDSIGKGPYQARPIELPDGRLAAMGKTRILVSDDDGAVWHAVGPTYPAGFTLEFFGYSPEQKAFYASGGLCNEQIKARSILKLEFDYEEY